MELIVTEFLHGLKIPISKKYVQKLIQAHADYPSLLSVSDVFQRLGVEHLVNRISQIDLIEMPFPYLLPLDKGKGDLLLIRSGMDLERHKEKLRQWGGIVLQAEPTKRIKDKINNDLYAKEKQIKIFSITTAAISGLFVLVQLLNSFSWLTLGLLLTALPGVLIGYLLMAKELGVAYKAVDDFCNVGKNKNCDNVLKADLQFLGLNLSDAVAFYFIFQFLAIVRLTTLPQVGQSFFSGLSVFSLSTLPIVVFSVYYQKFVTKTWCRLCLIVSVVLVAQFSLLLVASLSGYFELVVPSFVDMMALGGMFSFIGLCLMIIKTVALRSGKLNQIGGVGNRVRLSVEVFNHFLKKQKQIDPTPFEREVMLGNPDAPVRIIMVNNLYCNPCREKHEIVEELVSMYPEKVCVALRFVGSRRGDIVQKTYSVRHLLTYWLTNIKGKDEEQLKTSRLMKEWFSLWDFKKFKNLYPVDKEDYEGAMQLENQHYAWIEKNQINWTPAFFINGYQLPKVYSINDLLDLTISLSYNLSHERDIALHH